MSINNFRGIDHLDIDGFSKINLIFGDNNCGKTSILESIYAHACGLNLIPVVTVLALRRQDRTATGAFNYGEDLLYLFHTSGKNEGAERKFSISAKMDVDKQTYTLNSIFHPSSYLQQLEPGALVDDSDVSLLSSATKTGFQSEKVRIEPGKESKSLGKWNIQLNGEREDYDVVFPFTKVETKREPFKLAVLHDILAHREPGADIRIFAVLKRSGILEEFTTAMRDVFPEVESFDMIPYPDGTQGPIYVVTSDSRRIPLSLLGDGAIRWYYLLGRMILEKNCCHLIEEVEACFHPDAQRDLSHALVKYSLRYGNQIFITSHSKEFTDNFLDALYGKDALISVTDEDPVKIFTIKKTGIKGVPEVWPLTGRDAYEKRIKYDLELR